MANNSLRSRFFRFPDTALSTGTYLLQRAVSSSRIDSFSADKSVVLCRLKQSASE
jgi:hypothetical protein